MSEKELIPEEKVDRIVKRMDDNFRKIAETGIGADAVIGRTVLRLLATPQSVTKGMLEKDIAQQLANTRRGKDPSVKVDPLFYSIEFALVAIQSLPDSEQSPEEHTEAPLHPVV